MNRLKAIVARLATVPLGLRVLWVCAFLMLVGGSSTLTLLRTPDYTASVEAFTFSPRRGVPLETDRIAYLRRLLRDSLLPRDAASVIRFPLDVRSIPKRVHMAPTSRSVLVSATAGSPVRAAAIVNAVAIALANAGARNVGERAAALLVKARESLASAHSAVARKRLMRRIAQLASIVATPPSDIAIGPRATPPAPSRLVDRLLARLPGPLPPRPSLVMTTLAGALLTLMFCFGSYTYWASSKRAPDLEATTPATTSQKASAP